MDGLKTAIERVILDPKYHDWLGLVKAFRNGAVYGAKVRFPHALVMIFLFRNGTFREKAELIYKATRTHALNLARFAFTYKAVMLVMARLPHNPPGQKHSQLDPFVAGLVGGYYVFGRGLQSSVNQQIVIYVFARVVLALGKMSVNEGGVVPKEYRQTIANNAWPAFASLSWASVMWLHTYHATSLQSSLRSSMNYIYFNADTWSDLRTFIWHNS